MIGNKIETTSCNAQASEAYLQAGEASFADSPPICSSPGPTPNQNSDGLQSFLKPIPQPSDPLAGIADLIRRILQPLLESLTQIINNLISRLGSQAASSIPSSGAGSDSPAYPTTTAAESPTSDMASSTSATTSGSSSTAGESAGAAPSTQISQVQVPDTAAGGNQPSPGTASKFDRISQMLKDLLNMAENFMDSFSNLEGQMDSILQKGGNILKRTSVKAKDLAFRVARNAARQARVS
jgi:hypothetical protein